MATQTYAVTDIQAINSQTHQSQDQLSMQQQQTIIQQQGPPAQQFVQVTVSASNESIKSNASTSSTNTQNQPSQQQQQQQQQQQSSQQPPAQQPQQPQQQQVFTASQVQFVESKTDNSSSALETGGVSLQTSGGQTTVYPSHVSYVETGSGDHIYANGSMTNPSSYPYSEGATMYAQSQPTATYLSNPGTSRTVTHTVTNVGGVGAVNALGVTHSQLLSGQGGPYLIQGHTMDGEGHPITHTTRASPATLQWLINHFENCDGVSLPRSLIYTHYLRHCQDTKQDPASAATFGKVIRSVFKGLRTRRLGTRGNSKYHYYGIRIKASSPLNQLQDDANVTPMRQPPVNAGSRFKTPVTKSDIEESTDASQSGSTNTVSDAQQQQQSHQQYLGDASQALPTFGNIDFGDSPLPEGTTVEDLKSLQQLYREHCEAILDVVVNLQFALIEALWQTFWRNSQTESSQSNSEHEMEKRLSKIKLSKLCKCEPVLKYFKHYDHMLYQGLVEVLIPDVLRPIPSALTQAIRNFAKSLEGWLKNSMKGVPQDMINIKVNAVCAFAQTLRRYTSLNHLAQAARAVLQNNSQINQMLNDLNRVDFANVQEQASWVCQCEDNIVQRMEQDFKMTLQNQNTLEQWAIWLENVVNQVLKPHENSSNFPKAARQFLLKWSFYSSMIIRDLTLRSAASFGSFHLIRLLYDEYMFYLIEHKVATATGETPIAVMGVTTAKPPVILTDESAGNATNCDSPSLKRIKSS